MTLLNNGTGIATARESGTNGAYLFDSVEPGDLHGVRGIAGISQAGHENVLVQTRADVTVELQFETRRDSGDSHC